MKTLALGPFLLWRKVMKLCLSVEIRFLRVFHSIKVSKVYFFPRHNNSGAEFVLGWAPLNAKNPGFVVLMRTALVVQILAHRCFAQIYNSIVCRVAVNVVDKFLRPFAVNVKPRESVRFVSCVPNNYVPPPLTPRSSGDVADLCSSARYLPYKFPCLGVVGEKFSKILSGQFFFYNTRSHNDSIKVGLVRACVAVQTPHRLVQFTGVLP